MRTVASVLAVGVVAVVAALATLDALRGEPEPFPAELTGELVYSEEDCSRHAVRLPDLARRDFRTVGCGVFTRRDNLGIKDGVVAWFAYPVPGGTTVLLRNRQVREVAWLGERRFAAVLAPPARVTIWEGDRYVRQVARGSYRELRASPSMSQFAALGGGRVRVFDRRGDELWIGPGHAIAWSPDERFAAVAGESEVSIVATADGESVAKIPLSVADVDWRDG